MFFVGRRIESVSSVMLVVIACFAGVGSADADIQCTAIGTDGFQVCHQFEGKDGEYPEAGLTADKKGNLYSTTFGALGGGAPGKRCSKNCGDAFGLLQNDPGSLKILHSFQAGENDGAFPVGELVVGKGRVISGTTEYGPGVGCGGLGCGTAFHLSKVASDPGYGEQVVRFCQQPSCADGRFPRGGIIADKDENLYGTTIFGGDGFGQFCGSDLGGCGVVYTLLPDATAVVPIFSFCTNVQNNLCVDGANPITRLLLMKGSLYGTTQFGGTHGEGIVFKLSPNGDGTWTERVLYNFCATQSCSDGAIPEAGVASDGTNIYGTTNSGGTPCNDAPGCGVVFKLSPNGDGTWSETVLHSFGGVDHQDGGNPQNQLILDSNGVLYGTTAQGGVVEGGRLCGFPVTGCGTVFSVVGATGQNYQILHVFGSEGGAPDGLHPEGALVLQGGSLGPEEYLYGAAHTGGDTSDASPCKQGCGTLWRIDLLGARSRHSARPH